MRVLVTGADGFVGQHLVVRLLEDGEHVSAAALTLPPSRTILTPSQTAAVDWKAADVRDQGALFRLLAAVQPERIYHLAGFAAEGVAHHRAEQAMRVNAGGTVNLCEAILDVQSEFPGFRPRLLVMGAGDAYGDAAEPDEPVAESCPLRPVTVYGMSKAAQEIVAHTYRRAHGFDAVVARGFNLVGPGQEASFLVPNLCRQAIAIARGEAEPVMRVADPEVRRDYLDVRDGAAAFRRIMGMEDPEGAYNVCAGEATRVRQLARWIADEAGIDPELQDESERAPEERPLGIVGDPSRLSEQAGWSPERDLEETVREVYRWAESEE